MRIKSSAVIVLVLAMNWQVRAADEMNLVKEGYSLTTAEADQLEASVRRTPNDQTARLKLIGYYAGIPKSTPVEVVRARRADHILWLIQQKPKSALFQYITAVWKIFVAGDELADPEAFNRARTLWLAHIKATPRDEQLKTYAASFLELGDPQTAASLLNEVKKTRALGSLYAYVLLGLRSQDYKTGDPKTVDDSLRASDYANRILSQLRSSNDPMLIGGAGFWLAVQGGMLYADGKMSWDYTPLANELLEKARLFDPTTLDWYAVSTKLPMPGQRPPRVLRVGGPPLKSSLRKQVTPEYPPAAKAKGVEGVVNVNVVIGLDGKIVKAVVESDPTELAAATVNAIAQWEYAPTLLNGQAVFVITRITVNYRLAAGVEIGWLSHPHNTPTAEKQGG